jgi:hypothetical protein
MWTITRGSVPPESSHRREIAPRAISQCNRPPGDYPYAYLMIGPAALRSTAVCRDRAKRQHFFARASQYLLSSAAGCRCQAAANRGRVDQGRLGRAAAGGPERGATTICRIVHLRMQSGPTTRTAGPLGCRAGKLSSAAIGMSGRPGALRRRAPLRTGRARFRASGSSEPCWLAGGLTVEVDETGWSSLVRRAWVPDDVDRLAGGRQPLFPLVWGLWPVLDGD